MLYSACVKLSGIDTRAAASDDVVTTVWRGVDESQLSLPEHFFMKTFDNRGLPGGAEKAFMSATTDREVAYRYAGGTTAKGTIMEIEFDAASRGANVKFLSCAPHEEEWLLPPFTMISCKAVEERGDNESSMKRFLLCTITVNPSALDITDISNDFDARPRLRNAKKDATKEVQL